MTIQTYFGLDNDENSWLLVQRSEGTTVFLRRFKNTVDGLDELSKAIKSRCEKPRIYIRSTGCTALDLLKYLCGIPGIEVVFISQAGFKQYQTCLPKSIIRNSKATSCEAEILADCAERMI
ncbi:transposase [Methylobacter sp.]|uniref:IS110 family transposase n=1 Tax=Methylobacter sp. TaxID=2051955 RepID=UPI0024882349|nr:transposase [Methylobacter sp.]MDI1278881.1 transposase [Methylobacter sp.]MDI1359718.1 transposase [Methylobacter sp.]